MQSKSLVCLIVLGLATTDLVGQETQRPNIIIVLVDDMGYSDIGCYGGEIDTPNLDKLANGGLRFTQFYNSGRCCPTRASLMTGLHPHQVGIGHMTAPPNQPLGFQGPYQGYLNDHCLTIAQVLKASGYHTLMTGKWHLGMQSKATWPLQRGFDKFYGGLSGAFNYFRPGNDRGLTLDNQPVDPPADFYTTDDFTDVACEYISEVTEADDKPFFLYLAYNAPHWPLNAKWEEYLKYKGKYIDGWEALMERRLAKQKALGMWPGDITPAPHVGPKWDSLSEQRREDLDAIMAAYAGCIDSIDQNIGKLVTHLESIGQRENTVIFFLSDNGACQEGGTLGQGNEAMIKDPPLETTDGVRQGLAWANASNTPFRLYKHFVHEGGACTPMIASWPKGIADDKAGSFVRQAAYLPDFMATCIDLSGANYPSNVPPCEGTSIASLLRGNRDPIHVDPIYWEHEGNAAMRWGSWKLVREYEKPWELYDIANDRAEMNNLSEPQADKRKEMVGMWKQWATRNQVAFPERFNMYEFLDKEAKQKKKNARANAQEWTRFRGPNGSGVSDATTIPVQWTEHDYHWKVELPGVGHSSPVVWGDLVFLLSADPKDATRYMLCYSAVDGKQRWVRKYKSNTHQIHVHSSYASCTPAVDGDHVYVGWSTPDETTLKAFDHHGEEVWSIDLGRWVGVHGFGTSPILYDGMVILHNSQQAHQLDPGERPGDSFMMAFDGQTGKELWRTPLVGARVCYSVPFIFEPDTGPPELVCTSTGNGVFSLNPRTGEENWAVTGAFKMRTVSSPILAGGLVFGSNGSGGYSGNYLVAVTPGKNAELAYKLSNSSKFKAPYMTCAVARGDKVFLLYDRGFAACIDAPTGEIHWSERTGAAFSGSPVRVRDKIYCIDEDGVVWVLAADDQQYRVLAKNPLGEASRSTPAVSGGRMFLRTLSHLFCVGD